MALPIFSFEDGSEFLSKERIVPEERPYLWFETEDELRSWVAGLWTEAFEGKRAETERLKMCSLYYDGFHYTDAWLNRINPVANYCFSTVETVHPIMTEIVPRPEIVPRREGFDIQRINKLEEAAEWLMDTSKFDDAIALGARDKLKYGWNIWIISFDYRTGMPYPKAFSVFNFYPDPAATCPEDMEYFFLAVPVSTARLCASFPEAAESGKIQADNMASPGYDVHVRAFQMNLAAAHTFEMANTLNSAMQVRTEGEAPNNTVAAFSTSTGEFLEHGQTTMLLQLFVRDTTQYMVRYVGTKTTPATDGSGEPLVEEDAHYDAPEPSCKSGWRQINMTIGGVLLEPPRPVDECYGGAPIVMDFDYKQTDRMWAVGELDNAIPIQRKLNRRSTLIQRALELAAQPPVVTNRDSGLPADQDSVEAGELLRINRGSDLKYLEFRGPSESQFNMLAIDQRDFDTVTGNHDVQQGQRPAGIEAASAIRRLQEAALTRVRGKEGPAHRARAELVTKLLICMGKKLQPGISFRARGGDTMSLSSEELLDAYDLRFAQGSGTVKGREDMVELAFELFDRGAIDELELLKAVNWRGRDEVFMRVMRNRLLQASAEAEGRARAEAQGQSGGGKPSFGGKKKKAA